MRGSSSLFLQSGAATCWAHLIEYPVFFSQLREQAAHNLDYPHKNKRWLFSGFFTINQMKHEKSMARGRLRFKANFSPLFAL